MLPSTEWRVRDTVNALTIECSNIYQHIGPINCLRPVLRVTSVNQVQQVQQLTPKFSAGI